MSISNFSQKKSPNEEFLQSLEKELTLKALKTMRSLEGLSGLELTQAQLNLAFELERIRASATTRFCESEEYRNLAAHDNQTVKLLGLERKWHNTTVFEKRLAIKQSSNPDIANKRKSEMVHNSISIKKDSRMSLDLANNNFLQGKSIFENLNIAQLRNSTVIGLGQPLTGTKKSRDYSVVPNDLESLDSRPNIFYQDNSSDDHLDQSVNSGSDESIIENQTDLENECWSEFPVLSLVKQNRFIMDISNSDFRNILNPFKALISNPPENPETHKFSSFDDTSFFSLVFHNGRTVRTSRCLNTNKNVVILGNELTGNQSNEIIIRNSEKFFDSLNFGSNHKYNSIKAVNDDFSVHTHVFQNSLRCYASIPKQSKASQVENRVLFNFDRPGCFSVKIDSAFYGAFLNLNLASFDQNLLLEEGMVFLNNEKRGFGIQTIANSSQISKKLKILKELMNDDRCFIHCANLRQALLPNLCAFLKASFDPDSQFDILKNTGSNRLLKKFFFHILSTASTPIIVLSKVEFHQQYKLFQWKEHCLVFQHDFTNTPFESFFDQPNLNQPSFTVGQSLFKSQPDIRLRNPLTNLMLPYDLQFTFHAQVDRYSLSYPGGSAQSFVDLFDPDSCQLKWNSNASQSTEIDRNRLTEEEGVWVMLAKFDLFDELICAKHFVHLPFGSLVMLNQIVYFVSRERLAVKHILSN